MSSSGGNPDALRGDGSKQSFGKLYTTPGPNSNPIVSSKYEDFHDLLSEDFDQLVEDNLKIRLKKDNKGVKKLEN